MCKFRATRRKDSKMMPPSLIVRRIGKQIRTMSFVTSSATRSPRAVVLVLGFGGAKPRHVAKYSKLYSDKGCSTVSGTASDHDLFIDHSGLDAFARNAVEHVTKVLREDEAASCPNDTNAPPAKEIPIVMHITSNGGAFVTRIIGEMIDSKEHQQDESLRRDLDLFAARLKLQVFDSAPCYSDSRSSFNVIKHLIPNPFVGIPAAVLFTMRFYLRNAMSIVLQKPTSGQLFWNALLRDSNCNRQAFVYSHNDDIANAEMIEEFISERQKRGVDVYVKHLAESRHVQHLRLHGQEYSDFIDHVLTDMEDALAIDAPECRPSSSDETSRVVSKL